MMVQMMMVSLSGSRVIPIDGCASSDQLDEAS